MEEAKNAKRIPSLLPARDVNLRSSPRTFPSLPTSESTNGVTPGRAQWARILRPANPIDLPPTAVDPLPLHRVPPLFRFLHVRPSLTLAA